MIGINGRKDDGYSMPSQLRSASLSSVSSERVVGKRFHHVNITALKLAANLIA